MTTQVKRRDAIQDRLYIVFASVQLVPAALLLAFLIGSVVLSGGQVTAEKSPWGWWDVVVQFPIFVVADWLSIAIAVVAALILIPLVVLTRAATSGAMMTVFAYSGLASLANLFFAWTFPEQTGDFPLQNSPGLFAGLHWVAAVISAGCGLVGLVFGLIYAKEADRLQRERFKPVP